MSAIDIHDRSSFASLEYSGVSDTDMTIECDFLYRGASSSLNQSEDNTAILHINGQYYDATIRDGFWVLILNYNHLANTNPELTYRNRSFPKEGNTKLGNDESKTDSWGHVIPELLGKVPFDRVRFFGKTDNHNRSIHFETEDANVIDYISTGSGSFGTNFSYTTLRSHSANLPASTVSAKSDNGINALTEFPFYNGGNSQHWGIKGNSSRWEVDDYPGGNGSGYQYSTIHQIWIRLSDTSILVSQPFNPSPVVPRSTLFASNDEGYEHLVVQNEAGATGAPYSIDDLARWNVDGTRTPIDVNGTTYEATVDNGWVCILNYLHSGGTNPSLTYRSSSFPIVNEDKLGLDESGTEYWGHCVPSLMDNLDFDTVVFYGITSNHDRTIHFSSKDTDVIQYIKTGSGSFGTDFSYHLFAEHTAFLPGTTTNTTSNQGNEALTFQPYYEFGERHWHVRGGSGNDRWEVDDFPVENGSGYQFNTLHRVWVKKTGDSSRTLTYDFANGDIPSDYTMNKLTINGGPTSAGHSNDYSIGTTSNTDAILTRIEPYILRKGKQIERFSYWYNESSNGNGGAIRLLNSEGEIEMGAGTENPEYVIFSGNGDEQIKDPGENYNVWIRIIFDFDWTNKTCEIKYRPTDTSPDETVSRPLYRGLDIHTIEIVNNDTTNISNPPSGTQFNMSIDDISITFIEPEETRKIQRDTSLIRYDFEDGIVPPEFRTNNLSINGGPNNGRTNDYSIGATNDNADAILAEVYPPALRGGQRIIRFSFWYYETTNSIGGAIRLLNSDGTIEVGAGTENPEYDIYSNSGDERIKDPSSDIYQVWVKVIFEFDWNTNTCTFKFRPTKALPDATASRNMYKGKNIEQLQIVNNDNQNISNPSIGGKEFYMSIDDIEIELPETNQVGMISKGVFQKSNYSLVPNQKYRFRLEMSGTTAKMYINGDHKRTLNSVFDNAAHPLALIGNSRALTSGAIGRIENLRVNGVERSLALQRSRQYKGEAETTVSSLPLYRVAGIEFPSHNSSAILSSILSSSPLTVELEYFFMGIDRYWGSIIGGDGLNFHLMIPGSENTSVNTNEKQHIGWDASNFHDSGYELCPQTLYKLKVYKNGTNQRIYVNDMLVMDEQDTISLSTEPIKAIGGSTNIQYGPIGVLRNITIKDGNDTVIHHFPCNEGSGSKAYDTVGGNELTLKNDARWSQQLIDEHDMDVVEQTSLKRSIEPPQTYVPAQRAGSFNSSNNDYIALDSYLNSNDISELTIMAWIKTSNSTDIMQIIDYDNEYVQFFIENGIYKTEFGLSNGNTPTKSTDFTISNNKWHHLCTQFDNGNAKFYLDGYLLDSYSLGDNRIGSGNKVYGYISNNAESNTFDNPDNSGFFDGYIRDCRLYLRALSDNEIYQCYQGYVPLQSLHSYHSLTHSNNGVIKDESGNGRHGYLRNGASIVSTSVEREPPKWMEGNNNMIEQRGTLHPPISGIYDFSVDANGPASLYVRNTHVASKHGQPAYRGVWDADPDLVAHWTFDDVASGWLPDRSGNENLAETVGGPSQTSFGNIPAISFNGTDQYAKVVDPSSQGSISVPNNVEKMDEFTISCWILSESQDEKYNGRFIEVGGDSDSFILNQEYTNNNLIKLRFYIDEGGSSDQLITDGVIDKNVWYYIVALKTRNRNYIYIDGKLQTSKITKGYVPQSVSSINIGRWKSGGSRGYLKGNIADLRIYRRALSENEITNLYNSYWHGTPTSASPPALTGTIHGIKLERSMTYSLLARHIDTTDHGFTMMWRRPDSLEYESIPSRFISTESNTYRKAYHFTSDGLPSELEILDSNVGLGNGPAEGLGGSFSNLTETVATLKPNELQNGAQLQTFAFSYYETSSSTGAVVELRDINDTIVAGAGTSNPRFETYGTNDMKVGSYDVWYSVSFVFDWQTNRVSISFNGTNGDFDTTTNTLNSTEPIQTIAFVNNATWCDAYSAFYHSFDDIAFVYKPTEEAQSFSLGTGTYASVPSFKDDNLIAHWTFDDVVSGTIRDKSGTGMHGTTVNGPKQRYYKGIPTIQMDSASNQYVELNDTQDILSNTYPEGFTVSCWFNTQKNDTWRIIFVLGDSQNSIGTFLLWIDGKIRFRANGDSSFSLSNSSIDTNKWYHCTVSWMKDEQKLYVDGKIASTQTYTFSWDYYDPTPIRIGAPADRTSHSFDGQISDLRIYNYPFTAEEALDLYNSYFGKPTPSTQIQRKQTENNLPSPYAHYHLNAQIDSPLTATDAEPSRDAPPNLSGSVRLTANTSQLTNPNALQAIDAQTDEIVKDGLIGFWKMDRGIPGEGGRVVDHSGEQNHGTTYGGIGTGVDGPRGFKAMDFDGTDDYIEGTIQNFSGDQPHTISMWVYIRDFISTSFFIGEKNDNRASGFRIESDRIGWLFWSNDVSFPPLNLYQWYHIVAVYDGGGGTTSNKRIYYNGINQDVIGTFKNGELLNLPENPAFVIGKNASQTSNKMTNGKITHVRLYNRPLSELEVKHLYDQEQPNAGLIGYWTLQQNVSGNGGTVDDHSGNGNPGTTSGGVTMQADGPRGEYAMDFDGSDDYISGTLQGISGDQPHTIAFWVYLRSYGEYSFEINNNNTPNQNIVLQFQDSSTFKYAFWKNDIWYPGVSTNIWTHIICIYDGGGGTTENRYVYYNGIQQSYQNTKGGNFGDKLNLPQDPTFYIGGKKNLDGKLAHVRFYNRALSDAEARQFAQQDITQALWVKPQQSISGTNIALLGDDSQSNNEFGLTNGGPTNASDETLSGVINSYAYLTDTEIPQGSRIINVSFPSDNPGSFAAGDTILLIQMQVDDISKLTDQQSNYEFHTVQHINGTEIHLSKSTRLSYYSGQSNQATTNTAQIVKVYETGTATISSGSSVKCLGWNGQTGGIVALSCDTIDCQGEISVQSLGFRGAEYGRGNNDKGYEGEGLMGASSNAGRATPMREASGNEGRVQQLTNDKTGHDYSYPHVRNTGGQGGEGASHAGSGGGGGGHIDRGEFGQCAEGHRNAGGYSIPTKAETQFIYLGGSGGGGGDDDNKNSPPDAPFGGNGGGIVMLYAKSVSALTVDARGEDEYVANTGGGPAEGSGGAGGTIVVQSPDSINTSNMKIRGGFGTDVTSNGDQAGNGSKGVLYHLNSYEVSLSESVRGDISNQWRHVALTYNVADNVRTFYMNGQRVGYDIPSPITLSDGALFIGSTPTRSGMYPISISDYRLYTHVLQDQDIQRLYQIGAGKSSKAFSSSPSIQEEPQISGLFRYYPLNAFPNTWNKDLSGANDTLTNETDILLSNDAPPGLQGSIQFASTNAHLESTSNINPPQNWNHTHAFWIKTTQYVSNGRKVVAIGTPGTSNTVSGIQFSYDNNTNQIRWLFWNDDMTIDNKIEENVWNHYVFFFNGSTKTRIVYKNGIEIDSQSSDNVDIGDSPLQFGKTSEGNAFEKVKISDYRLYNRALTYGEVQQLYEYGRGNKAPQKSIVQSSPQSKRRVPTKRLPRESIGVRTTYTLRTRPKGLFIFSEFVYNDNAGFGTGPAPP